MKNCEHVPVRLRLWSGHVDYIPSAYWLHCHVPTQNHKGKFFIAHFRLIFSFLCFLSYLSAISNLQGTTVHNWFCLAQNGQRFNASCNDTQMYHPEQKTKEKETEPNLTKLLYLVTILPVHFKGRQKASLKKIQLGALVMYHTSTCKHTCSSIN